MSEEEMQSHLRQVILAKGPWKQVAVVETFAEMGDGLYGVGTPPPDYRPTLPNESIVAFLDDKRLVIADGAHPIRVCDAESGAVLKSFGEPLAGTYEHRTIALSPGGRLMTILPSDAPKIWDTVEGRLVGTLPSPTTFAVFFPDGRRMATYCGPGIIDDVSIRTWERKDDQQGFVSNRWSSVDKDINAQSLELAGPYLLIHGYRRSQAFDTGTLEVVLQQQRWTDEKFLFLDPPEAKGGAKIGVVEYRPDTNKEWRKVPLRLRLIGLPGATNLARWECPIEEDGHNDHRYQANYYISPAHTKLALAQEGRLNLYEFDTGKKIASLPAGPKHHKPLALFLDEDLVMISRWKDPGNGDVAVVRISTGEDVAVFSEGFPAAMSPDRRHFVFRRAAVPVDVPGNGKAFAIPTRQIVSLWKQTEEYPAKVR